MPSKNKLPKTKEEKKLKNKLKRDKQKLKTKEQKEKRLLNIKALASSGANAGSQGEKYLAEARSVSSGLIKGAASDKKKLAKIELSLAIPQDNPPSRFGDGYNTMPTALARPPDIFPAPWSPTSAAGTYSMNNKLMLFAAFRDVERASITSFKNVSACKYDLYGRKPYNQALVDPSKVFSLAYTTSEIAPKEDTPDGTSYRGSFYLPFVAGYPTSTTISKPHSDIWLASTPDGEQTNVGRYFWLDKGTKINTSVVSSGWTTQPTWQIIFDLYDQNGDKPDAQVSAQSTGTANVTTTIAVAGYYTQRVYYATSNGTASANGIWTISTEVEYDGIEVAGHRPTKDFSINFAAMGQTRVLGVSIFYQNSAANIQKQGEIYQIEVPKGKQWFSFYNDSIIATIDGIQTARQGLATKGGYSFLKPTSELVFEPQVHYQVVNGRLYDSYYPFMSDGNTADAYILFGLNIEDGDEGGVAQKGIITYCHSLEYQTLDFYRNAQSPSEITKKVYTEAVFSLSKIPQHYENAIHFSQIWKKIKSGAQSAVKGLLEYGPMALSMAERYGPILL